jgi:hypothetical protein
MATFRNNIIGSIRVPPLSSACLHTIPHTRLSVGGPYTISVNISRGMVGYRPTTIVIELCRFTGSHKASMCSLQFKYSLRVPLLMVLNRHRKGLPPWSLEYPHPSPLPSHPMILCFIVAPPGIKLNYQNKTPNKNLSKSTSVKKGDPTCEWDLPVDFYHHLALSIAHLMTTRIYKVTRITWKDKLNATTFPPKSYT